jgi:hypothetical protein
MPSPSPGEHRREHGLRRWRERPHGRPWAPTHVKNPVFEPNAPGFWLVDLSHVDLSRVKVAKDKWAQLDAGLLTSPFPPKGERPEGPALVRHADPRVLAYAVELGYDVAPIEAYVRHDNGRRYLDAWYDRLRDAHLTTVADLGMHADLSSVDFLAAMDGYRLLVHTYAHLVVPPKQTANGCRPALSAPRLHARRPVVGCGKSTASLDGSGRVWPKPPAWLAF